jgi:hypothetical protein
VALRSDADDMTAQELSETFRHRCVQGSPTRRWDAVAAGRREWSHVIEAEQAVQAMSRKLVELEAMC